MRDFLLVVTIKSKSLIIRDFILVVRIMIKKYCLMDFSAGGDPFSSPPENTIYIQTVNITKYKGWVEVKLYM